MKRASRPPPSGGQRRTRGAWAHRAIVPLAALLAPFLLAVVVFAPTPRDPPAARPESQRVSGYLGVLTGPMTTEITAVLPSSPAALAALREGDTIRAVDGELVTRPEGLARMLAGRAPGDAVVVAVLRDGRRLDAHVRLGAPPGVPSTPQPGQHSKPQGAPRE